MTRGAHLQAVITNIADTRYRLRRGWLRQTLRPGRFRDSFHWGENA